MQMNSIPLPAILAVFRAEQLDNYGLFTVDSNLIYSIVDVLLGGRRGTAAMRIEGRPIARGIYGLHMIPSATSWTVIFASLVVSGPAIHHSRP